MKTMNKTAFEILKWIGRIALPAIGALYGTLATIWNLPYGEAIVATISALSVFLNAILAVDSSNYFKQNIIVPADENNIVPENENEINGEE